MRLVHATTKRELREPAHTPPCPPLSLSLSPLPSSSCRARRGSGCLPSPLHPLPNKGRKRVYWLLLHLVNLLGAEGRLFPLLSPSLHVLHLDSFASCIPASVRQRFYPEAITSNAAGYHIVKCNQGTHKLQLFGVVFFCGILLQSSNTRLSLITIGVFFHWFCNIAVIVLLVSVQIRSRYLC